MPPKRRIDAGPKGKLSSGRPSNQTSWGIASVKQQKAGSHDEEQMHRPPKFRTNPPLISWRVTQKLKELSKERLLKTAFVLVRL